MSDLKLIRIGYFGKVPARGDFVSRNVDIVFKEKLDSWLQLSIEKSRQILDESWLNNFLTSPIWRFVIDEKLDSDRTHIGIMIPSVDKVGRYFPFLILLELEGYKGEATDIILCDQILHELEPFLLSILKDDFDLDYFDYQLRLISKKLSNSNLSSLLSSKVSQVLVDPNEFQQNPLSEPHQDCSVWWTEGSDNRSSEFLVYQQMPNPNVFASFLRDSDSYSDLEDVWLKVKDFGARQNTNDGFESNVSCPTSNIVAITHNGTLQSANSAIIIRLNGYIG